MLKINPVNYYAYSPVKNSPVSFGASKWEGGEEVKIRNKQTGEMVNASFIKLDKETHWDFMERLDESGLWDKTEWGGAVMGDFLKKSPPEPSDFYAIMLKLPRSREVEKLAFLAEVRKDEKTDDLKLCVAQSTPNADYSDSAFKVGMKSLIEVAKQQGCKAITTETTSFQEQAFYRNMGFEIVKKFEPAEIPKNPQKGCIYGITAGLVRLPEAKFSDF